MQVFVPQGAVYPDLAGARADAETRALAEAQRNCRPLTLGGGRLVGTRLADLRHDCRPQGRRASCALEAAVSCEVEAPAPVTTELCPDS